MHNRWASTWEAIKKRWGNVASSREQARTYYEMVALAPLLVVAVFPGMLVQRLTSR